MKPISVMYKTLTKASLIPSLNAMVSYMVTISLTEYEAHTLNSTENVYGPITNECGYAIIAYTCIYTRIYVTYPCIYRMCIRTRVHVRV
jgi:hypothetical protein